MPRKYWLILAALLIVAGGTIYVYLLTTQTTPKSGDIKDTTVAPNLPGSSEPGQNGNPGGSPTAIAEDAVYSAINAKVSSLVDKTTNKPLYTIVSQSSPTPGWVIAKIRHTQLNLDEASVVFQIVKGKPVLKAGPGTSFTKTPGLPPAVREALK